MASTVTFKDDTDIMTGTNTTQNDTTLMSKTQSSPFHRSGNHKTIYGIKKNPKIEDKDIRLLQTDKDEKISSTMTGSSYVGGWENNMKHGVGIENISSTLTYEGEYQHNKFHGNGVLFKTEQTKNKHNPRKAGKDIKIKLYEGEWARGLKSGTGTYYYKNNDVYVGSWRDDMRHGNGVLYVSSSDDIYECEWKDGLQDGIGSVFCKNGNIYSGAFCKGYKEGAGKFYYASTRKLYEGEWIEDQPSCGEFRDVTLDERKMFDGLTKQHHFLINSKNNMNELDKTIRGENRSNKSNNSAPASNYRINLPELGVADPSKILEESKQECSNRRK